MLLLLLLLLLCAAIEYQQWPHHCFGIGYALVAVDRARMGEAWPGVT
jgi:hypothetical protein